jgi:hypothetical protein
MKEDGNEILRNGLIRGNGSFDLDASYITQIEFLAERPKVASKALIPTKGAFILAPRPDYGKLSILPDLRQDTT